MSTIEEKILIRWYDRTIKRIQEKIEGEIKNLADSGITEGNPMYDDYVRTVQKEDFREMLQNAVMRHRLKPFESEVQKQYDKWMVFLFNTTLNDPPEELLYARKTSLTQKSHNEDEN